MVMGYTVTSGSFVVHSSQDERSLIRITALGARMRGSYYGGVPEAQERNEENSARNVSNEQDVYDEAPRIFRL
jgi:hypothetical protein